MSNRNRIAIGTLLIGFVIAVHAQSPGLDLGSIKPKSSESAGATKTTTSTSTPTPIGASPLKKPIADSATTGSPGLTTGASAGGIGTSIRNPLSKGVLGSGTASKSTAQEDTAASNDVVVKMPSNMKK